MQPIRTPSFPPELGTEFQTGTPTLPALRLGRAAAGLTPPPRVRPSLGSLHASSLQACWSLLCP